MSPKQKLIVLYTLIRKELVRMFRIASQVFLPSVITTALYFLIFGTLIGKRSYVTPPTVIFLPGWMPGGVFVSGRLDSRRPVGVTKVVIRVIICYFAGSVKQPERGKYDLFG